MPGPAVVTIIGAPVTCRDGVKDSWREVAEWAGKQLQSYFGETVEVRYNDLFADDVPMLLPDAKLPLVLVNGEVLSSGGKISVPAIRKQLEVLGLSRY